jgi:hypothetical protein
VNAFHNARDAKEYLVDKITAQAQQENAPLSEVGRKMLYYTESGWTLPDMEAVYDDFEREYDQAKYEKRIARLIRKAYKHACSGSREEYDAWWEATRRLGREDHYLSVIIRLAGLRPRGDLLRLWGCALLFVAVFIGFLFLSLKYGIEPGKYLPSRSAITVFIWATLLAITVFYLSSRWILGGKKVDDWVFGIIEKLVRFRARFRNR